MVLRIRSRDIPEKPTASASAEQALRSSVPSSTCNPQRGMLRHNDIHPKLSLKACCTLRSTLNTRRGEVLRICDTSEDIAKHRERLDEDPVLQSSNAAGSTKPPSSSSDLQQNAHTRTWEKQTTARLAHDRRDEREKKNVSQVVKIRGRQHLSRVEMRGVADDWLNKRGRREGEKKRGR